MSEPMHPEKIVESLAAKAGLSVSQVRAFLQAQAEMAAEYAKDGYPLPGIGLLYRVDNPAREMVMKFGPKAGQTISVPSKKKLKFTIAPSMKDVVLGIKKAMPDVFTVDWYWPDDELAGDSIKPVDFRTDQPVVRKYLDARIAAFAGNQPISAIEVGFKLCQAGTIVFHFDTRSEHKRDGKWTSALDGIVLDMPHWHEAYRAVSKFGISFVGLDGNTHTLPPPSSDAAVAGMFGEFLRTIMIQALQGGAFARLPLRADCQLDLEEFDGMWAWPASLGRENLVAELSLHANR